MQAAVNTPEKKKGNAVSEKLLAWTPWLFWGFYAVFLVSSIPHLADWFRHTDGVQPVGMDQWYWVLAYGKAIAIDGADVLLTLSFLRLVNKPEKSGWDIAKVPIIILLVIGFTGYSWYLNWQYETQFITNAYALVDTKTNFFGWNVGQSNPAIGSALQLFALVFTLIADTLLAKNEEKTVEELRQELTDKQERAGLEKQLRAYKPEKKGFIQRAKQTAIEAKEAIKEVRNSGETTEENESNPEPITEEIEKIAEGKVEGKATGKPKENGGKHERTEEEKQVVLYFPDTASWVDSSATTVLKDAVKDTLKIHTKTWNTRMENAKIRKAKPTKNGEENWYKDSAIAWVISEFVPKKNGKIVSINAARKSEETVSNLSEDSGEMEAVSSM